MKAIKLQEKHNNLRVYAYGSFCFILIFQTHSKHTIEILMKVEDRFKTQHF